MTLLEVNLDGLVGPTHNYAGLAFGNVASEHFRGTRSHPREAALQGLAKMRLLHDKGVHQLVMPPHPRPDTQWLTRLGFAGDLRQQVMQVAKDAPKLLPVMYSSSGMWAANAATVCPAPDAQDGKTHFTPANLASTTHRSIEPAFTSRALRRIFPDASYFAHHESLPGGPLFTDEGAANHMRLSTGGKAIHLFIYGREGAAHETSRFPARQTLAASQAVARLHTLSPQAVMFIRQNPAAIDAGVFHNDVIATSHENLLFYHELAFAEGDAPVEEMKRRLPGVIAVKVRESDLPLAKAVSSYLFNSQIVSGKDGMTLIAPNECRQDADASAVIARWLESNEIPIAQVHYADLRQSMQNGGGPACLRLRVQLTPEAWSQVHPGVKFDHALHERLSAWVNEHYRETLELPDLADPELALDVRNALLSLEKILGLDGLYAG